MPRPSCIHVLRKLYHLTARGTDGQAVYPERANYKSSLQAIQLLLVTVCDFTHTEEC